MRGRSLTALALSAVVAAVCVAVPALAGSSAHKRTAARVTTSDSSAIRSAAGKSASKERCESAGTGKHRVVLCAITGAAGPAGRTGPRGFVGTRGNRGSKGTTGDTGATGPTGAAGSARAYAVVSLKSGSLELVPTLTHGFLTVKRLSREPRPGELRMGVYCLAPAAGINPATEPAIASGESSFGRQAPEAAPVAVVNAQPAAEPDACASGEYKVETFLASPSGTSRSEEVAFSIAVP